MLWLRLEEPLFKARRAGMPAGKMEGASVKNILKNPKKIKSRPGSTGAATLKSPQLGKVAGHSKLSKPVAGKPATGSKPHPKQGPFQHGQIFPGYFRRGQEHKFELGTGEKGSGKIRDVGTKGVQILGSDGRILHVFFHEIRERVEKQDANRK